MNFNLFNCFCRTTLTAKTQSTFSENFPPEKRTIFRWKNAKYDQRKCKWWKIGIFCRSFGPKSAGANLFSAAENHIFFAEAAGLTRLVLSIFSVLSLSYSTNQLQTIPVERKSLLYTGVRVPQFSWWTLPFRGSWVVFLP